MRLAAVSVVVGCLNDYHRGRGRSADICHSVYRSSDSFRPCSAERQHTCTHTLLCSVFSLDNYGGADVSACVW